MVEQENKNIPTKGKEDKMKVEKEIKDASGDAPSVQSAPDKSDKIGKEKVVANVEEKVEAKKENKKAKKENKKDIAIANGFSMKISPKQCKYTCRVIRGKSPESAVARLQDVIDEKRPVPMASLEVGHKKGRGLAGGKFPKNACKGIIEIIKQAAANAIIMGIENPVIAIAKSNQASAPYRKAGRKAKRTHIYIEIRDRVKMMEAKKK